MATIAASDRTSRHVTTPILLPESDMAYWVTIIAISQAAALRPHCECVTQGEHRGGPLGTHAATGD